MKKMNIILLLCLFAYKSWPSFTLSGGSVETTLVKRVTNTGSVLN